MTRPAHYLALARVDHWVKNSFMLPGLILGMAFAPSLSRDVFFHAFLALASVCLISSANYIINEWLDRGFDQFHPYKKHRPSLSENLRAPWVYALYAAVAILGLGLAYAVNRPFFITSVVFLIMGWVYNIAPIRSKDLPYLDVISESANNPLRLLLGWYAVVPFACPPGSLLLAYWLGGAFLMTVKRLSEFRFFKSAQQAARYRKSFAYYTEPKLLLCALFYAMTSSLMLGVFVVRYRLELILTFPGYALLFLWYLTLGLKEDSAAQHPEKLYKERGLMAYLITLSVASIGLLFWDIPILYTWIDAYRISHF